MFLRMKTVLQFEAMQIRYSMFLSQLYCSFTTDKTRFVAPSPVSLALNALCLSIKVNITVAVVNAVQDSQPENDVDSISFMSS